MIPQYRQQIPPTVVTQRDAGLAAAAQAQIGSALSQAGDAFGSVLAAHRARLDAQAVGLGLKHWEEWFLVYERELVQPERRRKLWLPTVDPETQESSNGYQDELKLWPEKLRAKYDEIAARLSPRAREQMDSVYNRTAPRWADRIARTLDTLETEDAVAEMDRLAGEDRASEALELFAVYEEKLRPAARHEIKARIQQAAIAARLRVARDVLRDVGVKDGWDVAAQLLTSSDFQKAFELDLDQTAGLINRLQTIVNQGKVQEQAALEADREKARDVLNDKLAAGALSYDDIDASPLDENEQQRYVGWMQQDLDRRLAGQNVNTDEAVRHQLKARALDIARGRAEYSDVITAANEAKAAGKLDDDAYRDVLTAARSELAGLQAEALRSASRSAERQLVTISESASERYGELMATGGSGAKEALTKAENRRQFEFRLLDLHDTRVRDFIKSNPDAPPDEIHKTARRILLGLRQAGAAERARLLEEWDRDLMTPASPSAPVPAAQAWGEIPFPGAAAPAGLEPIWDQLTPGEKVTVRQLLDQGHTADDLLRHFRAQAATPR